MTNLQTNLPDAQAHLPEMLDLWQATLNWQPTDAQQQQFQQLYDLIVNANQQLNLTRITEPTDFWEKHLWDSLRGLLPWLNSMSTENSVAPNCEIGDPSNSVLRIVDIGTGGGFPGVPAAIALPQSQVTLLDSTQKKITFLQTLVQALALTRVIPLVNRAELFGHDPQHRESYDMAVLRAIAPANVCAEYALPLLTVGGTAVLYRGQWSDEEHQALEQACRQLGGAIASVDAFTTPMSHGVRHCVYLKKLKHTSNRFPRAVGIPTRQPLGTSSKRR